MRDGSAVALIRRLSELNLCSKLSSYHKQNEEKEEVKGHNHPYNDKCGPHCPRNAHYRGPVKRPDFRRKK